ncbi:MAG TPA: hypothetical protein DCF62_14455 [Porticoccaceae bacterium]|nr:hypothetical protein [Porticoccaceae bacterium]
MVDQNNEFEAIEASDVALSGTQDRKPPPATMSSAPASSAGVSATLIYRYLIATVVLIVGALSLVFWQKLQPPGTMETPTDTAAAPVTTGTDDAPDLASSNALKEQQLRNQRRAAQDALAGIMEKRQSLEARQVTLWAEADYRAANEKTSEGDSLYQKGRYQQAAETYQNSLEQLNVLESRIAPLLEKTLATGATAIDQGDIDEARRAYTMALALAPTHPAAQSGLERLEQLPRVLELLDQAEGHLAQGAYKHALASFEQALTLDSVNTAAQKGREQTRNLIRDKNFNDALNQGFSHLQATSYPAAISAFEQALELSPQSTSARQALSQARSEYNQQRVGLLLQEAVGQEQREQWRDAVTSYQATLTIDNSVVDAKIGLARSQARAKLDKALEALINEPLRLSSPAVYGQAKQLLADARQLGVNSPRLSRQIQQVESLLIVATTPTTVQLTSDNKTSVTILRVAALGQFAQKQVELKPGKYVAEGVRKGYRDVRVAFTVSGSGTLGPIEIACREAI